MKPKIRILLIGKHVILIRGIKRILEYRLRAEVSEIVNIENIYEIIETKVFDLLFFYMPQGKDDRKTLVQIRKQYPALKVLVMISENDHELHFELSINKLASILYENCDEKTLIQTIIQVNQNDEPVITLDLVLVNKLQAKEASLYANALLSLREFEIAKLLHAGHNHSQIAQNLQLSVNTVRTHKRNIYLKTKSRNLNQLAEFLRMYHLL